MGVIRGNRVTNRPPRHETHLVRVPAVDKRDRRGYRRGVNIQDAKNGYVTEIANSR